MFSGLLDPLRRNIGVRLSLWYALIFTAQQRRALRARLLPAGGRGRQQGPRGARGAAQGSRHRLPGRRGRGRSRELGAQPAARRAEHPVRPPGQRPFNTLDLRERPARLGELPRRATGLGRSACRSASSAFPQSAERDFILAAGDFAGRLACSRWAASPTAGRPSSNPIRRSFLLVGSVTVLLGFLAGAFFAHRAMQPGAPDRRHRPLDHPHRPAGCARAGARARMTSWTNWCGCSTRCWTRTRPSSAPCANRSTTSPTTCARRWPGCAAWPKLALQPGADPAAAREALADCVEESERVLEHAQHADGHHRGRSRHDEAAARAGGPRASWRARSSSSTNTSPRRSGSPLRTDLPQPCEAVGGPHPDAAGVRQPARQRHQVHAGGRRGAASNVPAPGRVTPRPVSATPASASPRRSRRRSGPGFTAATRAGPSAGWAWA